MLTLTFVIEVAALLIGGTMVGNEIAVAAIVHPDLSRLDERTHTRSVQALARTLGRIMPFWYAVTLLLCIAVLLVARTPWSLAWCLSPALCILHRLYDLQPCTHQQPRHPMGP